MSGDAARVVAPDQEGTRGGGGSRVARFPQAQAERAVCQLCFGTGQHVVPGRGARRCDCKRAEDLERLVTASRLPRRYRRCTLDRFEPEDGNLTHSLALGCARKLVSEYPAIDRGLLFAGPCGTGKTHLACGILLGLLEKGVPCLFYEFGSLLKQIQSSYNPSLQTSESQVLAPLYEAEVLVLDELGATRPSEWVLETMLQIIGNRYNEERLTVITTNFADERRTPAGQTLEDRVGARLRSRLYQMCRTVRVEGADYRRRFDA